MRALLQYGRINFRGFHISMTELLLHGANIGVRLQ